MTYEGVTLIMTLFYELTSVDKVYSKDILLHMNGYLHLE